MARKVGDIDQRDSDAMKGQEEKLSDGGKGIIAVAETIDDNDDRSKKVREVEEQESHEEEIYRKQFQKLVIMDKLNMWRTRRKKQRRQRKVSWIEREKLKY
uniref:Uncharacterized protein n=1 Tax=Noccaea caerulescens TaxID=107243 RepID=A0A1J3K4C4_NOCCA